MKTYKLINMTPHPIDIVSVDGQKFTFASTGIARCSAKTEVVEQFKLEGCGDAVFERTRSVYGDVEGLPTANTNTLVVGSMLVAQKANRADIVSPGTLIRDEAGRPVGAKGVSDPS